MLIIFIILIKCKSNIYIYAYINKQDHLWNEYREEKCVTQRTRTDKLQ